MKGVIASAVIAVVIVAGSVAYTNHIDKVSRDLGEINDRVMAIMRVPVMKSKNLYSILTKIVLYLPQQAITRILIKLK